jgi:hypothetical protein
MGIPISSLLSKVNAGIGVNLLNLMWIGIAADGLHRSAAVRNVGYHPSRRTICRFRGYI